MAYHVPGFLDKNRDMLLDGLIMTGAAADDAVLSALFADDAAAIAKKHKAGAAKTLGARFRQQLKDLVDALGASSARAGVGTRS